MIQQIVRPEGWLCANQSARSKPASCSNQEKRCRIRLTLQRRSAPEPPSGKWSLKGPGEYNVAAGFDYAYIETVKPFAFLLFLVADINDKLLIM